MTRDRCSVRPAVWPQDLGPARSLLRSYEAHLRLSHIVLTGYDEELATLDRRWGPPHAALLFGVVDGRICGCVAVHLLPHRPGSAEFKRMWVDPSARGCGAGLALGLAAICWAQAHGASELLLDTVPAAMPGAIRLYAALGFEPTERYNENPVAGVAFFRRTLHTQA